MATSDHVRHRPDQARGVLVVGVNHDDDLRAQFERGVIASLLVATVTKVFFMDNGAQSELAGNLDCIVSAGVIDDQNFIRNITRNLGNRSFEGFLRMVRGHHHHYFFAVNHMRIVRANPSIASHFTRRIQVAGLPIFRSATEVSPC